MKLERADSARTDDRAAADLTALARLLRTLRHERRLSLEELARASGVSTGAISQLERGLANPSFSTLVRLAYGMGVPVSRLFVQDDREPPGRVVRADRRKRLVASDPSGDFVYELLTPDLNRSIEMLRVEVASGFENSDRPFVHTGEECVHVLSGQIFIYLEGAEFLLNEGDSITYDSSMAHWYKNPFSNPAVTICAVTPPSF